MMRLARSKAPLSVRRAPPFTKSIARRIENIIDMPNGRGTLAVQPSSEAGFRVGRAKAVFFAPVRSVLSLGIILGFLSSLHPASGQKLSLDEVPPAVKLTIKKQTEGGQLAWIERDEEEGEISFTIQFTNKAGTHRELTVADDGALLTLEVALDELPLEVQKTIRMQMGQNKIKQIDKTFEEGDVSYEVDISLADGKTRACSVDAAGKLTRLQIGLEALPDAVRKTIDANLHGGALVEAYKLIDEADISYEGEVEREGKNRELVVAADGKLESMELSIAEVTGQARKTIEEKVGNGKLVRVEKIFEQKQGVMPYEVEARKDGKLIRFSVGPRGRFLGVEP